MKPLYRLRWVAGVALMSTGCFVSDAELLDALDRDGDGFQPVVAGGMDCAEELASVNPEASEVCGDGIDNNCDGFIDDDGVGARIWYRDADGDGFGVGDERSACTEPEGYAPVLGDCDDTDPAFNPAVDDLCDGLDQDCDGIADDEVPFVERFRDADGDGFGTSTETALTCDEQPGFVNQAGDCDDNNSAINPAAEDFCDGQDQNCNGLIDEGAIFVLQYRDADGDGFGDPSETTEDCAAAPGFAFNSDDCDDGAAGVNPLAEDLCDGVDQDCDSFVDDDAEFFTYFADADGDGTGDATQQLQLCGPPPLGYVPFAGDCDDNDADQLALPWYRDADGDGVGSELIVACEVPPGFVAESGDCDDANPEVYPGREEVCKNGVDDDCDPETDCRLRGVIDPFTDGLPTMPIPLGTERMNVRYDYFGSPLPEVHLLFADGTSWIVDLDSGDLQTPLVDLEHSQLSVIPGDVSGDGVYDVVARSNQSVRVWEGGPAPVGYGEFSGLVDVSGIAAAESTMGSGLWISDEYLEETFFVLFADGPTSDVPATARFSEPVFGYDLGRTQCLDGPVVVNCSLFGEMGHLFALADPGPSNVVFEFQDPDLYGAPGGLDWLPIPLLIFPGFEHSQLRILDVVSSEEMRFPIPLDSSNFEDGISVAPTLGGGSWSPTLFDCDGDGSMDFSRGSAGETHLSVRYSNEGPTDFTILGSSAGQILPGVDWDSDGYDDFLVVRTNPWSPQLNAVAIVYGSGP